MLGGPAGDGLLWFPATGVALALVAWLGARALVLIAVASVLVAIQDRLVSPLGDHALSWLDTGGVFGQAALEAAQAGAGWWCYHRWGRGARCLSDPRSAIVFLLVVPGLVAALFAALQGLTEWQLGLLPGSPLLAVSNYWLGHALGLVTLAPPLLAVMTPALLRHGLLRRDADPDGAMADASPPRLTQGDWIEVGGLAVAAGGFGALVVFANGGSDLVGWQVWAVPLLLIVWAALRQGLPGGTLVAAVAIAWPLLVVVWYSPARGGPVAFGFRGNLLTEGSLALLIAASMSWVRASEARYRRVVGHIPVLLYSVRLQTPGTPTATEDAEITFVSPASRVLLDCPPERLLGRFGNWLAQVDPHDREILLAAVAQLHRQSQPVTCEYRLARGADPSGAPVRERWMRDTLAPRLTSDGRLDGWEGVLNDITEQRALAGDLRRTTSMFQALVANLPAGVFFVGGPAGQPILVNARARQLLGQREEALCDLRQLPAVYQLCRPDGRPYPAEELPVYQALRHGTTAVRDDIVVCRREGRRIPLITWAAPIHLGRPGEPDAAVWVLEDLTALRQSEEKYRGLVESLPVGVVQLDQDLQVVHVNPALQAMSGCSMAELHKAAAWQALFHPEDLPQLTAAFAAALAGQTERLQVRYRARDGDAKMGYLVCQPQRRVGEIIGITCLILDVTRERQLEQDLQRSQRAELVGRMASGAVHDFNNLLTLILSLAELARDQLPTDHPACSELARIGEAGEQAAAVARQLLTFGRPHRASSRIVDVNQVVGRTLALLRRTLPGTIEVKYEGWSGPLAIHGDETQLQQVVMNLCLNARDAMPAGGRLVVRTAAEETAGKEGWVRLTVEDTGEGMSEAVRVRVFETFFSTKERGSGLGLAVVQQIVTDHGGRVEVNSRPGEGARFDVWLPSEPLAA
jgi:PAS domain S-box-containing protein